MLDPGPYPFPEQECITITVPFPVRKDVGVPAVLASVPQHNFHNFESSNSLIRIRNDL
jgi:hypothetical protein